MSDKVQSILKEVKKAVIGKDDIVKKVFAAILSGGHILLEDVPGVGKTTLALSFGKALGLDCRRVQFTSDTMPSDITGFSVYSRSDGKLAYQQGCVITNLLLADEINRASSKTQSALLEVMEEKQVTVDGITHKLPSPFIVIATQNPTGSAGTQLLPNSQLDRFMIRLKMGYPEFEGQVNILKEYSRGNSSKQICSVTDREELIGLQKKADSVFTDDSIYEYVVRLADETRSSPLIELGISPRGAIAICRMAKAQAYISGRDYVIPDDIAEIFSDTSAHRIILSRKARLSDKKPSDILGDILKSTQPPSIKKGTDFL